MARNGEGLSVAYNPEALVRLTRRASGVRRASPWSWAYDLEEAIYLADRVLIMPKEKGGAADHVDLLHPHFTD